MISTFVLEKMEKTVSVGIDGLSQHLDVNQTSADMELRQEPLVTVKVAQNSVSSSSHPFSIERILQPGPSSTATLWTVNVEDQTAAREQSSINHQHLSTWSSSWPANYVSTTTQQFGYPAVNVHATGTLYSMI